VEAYIFLRFAEMRVEEFTFISTSFYSF